MRRTRSSRTGTSPPGDASFLSLCLCLLPCVHQRVSSHRLLDEAEGSPDRFFSKQTDVYLDPDDRSGEGLHRSGNNMCCFSVCLCSQGLREEEGATGRV